MAEYFTKNYQGNQYINKDLHIAIVVNLRNRTTKISIILQLEQPQELEKEALVMVLVPIEDQFVCSEEYY